VLRFDPRIRKIRKCKVDTVVHFAVAINGQIDANRREHALQTTGGHRYRFPAAKWIAAICGTGQIFGAKRDRASGE
jgi:hypothetical protein